ncbi:sodium-dependent transporter [Lentisphaerota bacterium WC36G]|nr:sodium-dependent transporter [Lentisphaerae bacterium WC36]
MAKKVQREHWSSSLGFVLAATGSAVGLGNIWKFSYITGENGGGAFVLIYLLSVALIGLPLLLCELAIGRNTQLSAVSAFDKLKPKVSLIAHIFGAIMVINGISLCCFGQIGFGILSLLVGALIFIEGWTIVGILATLVAFIIACYYTVVGGWTIFYTFQGFGGNLAATESTKDFFLNFISIKDQMSITDSMTFAEQTNILFHNILHHPVFYHFIFITLCSIVLCFGIKKGVERTVKFMMPLLFLILIFIAIRSVSLPGAMKGVKFLFATDFGKLKAESIVLAISHSFFTLSLGMGIMVAYGSYLPKTQNIFKSAIAIISLDTLVALLAGLAIFPALFSLGLKPGQGAGLAFITFPTVLSNIPGGTFWTGLFFFLLFVAAFTSQVSIMEVSISFLIDKFNIKRIYSVIIIAVTVAIIGCFIAVSANDWQHLPTLEKMIKGAFSLDTTTKPFNNFLDLLNIIVDTILLPVTGILTAVFVGWVWGTKKGVDEIRHGSENFADVHLISFLAGLRDDKSHNSNVHVLTLASLWGIFIRFAIPVAIMIVIFDGIQKNLSSSEPSKETSKAKVVDDKALKQIQANIAKDSKNCPKLEKFELKTNK